MRILFYTEEYKFHCSKVVTRESHISGADCKTEVGFSKNRKNTKFRFVSRIYLEAPQAFVATSLNPSTALHYHYLMNSLFELLAQILCHQTGDEQRRSTNIKKALKKSPPHRYMPPIHELHRHESCRNDPCAYVSLAHAPFSPYMPCKFVASRCVPCELVPHAYVLHKHVPNLPLVHLPRIVIECSLPRAHKRKKESEQKKRGAGVTLPPRAIASQNHLLEVTITTTMTSVPRCRLPQTTFGNPYASKPLCLEEPLPRTASLNLLVGQPSLGGSYYLTCELQTCCQPSSYMRKRLE